MVRRAHILLAGAVALAGVALPRVAGAQGSTDIFLVRVHAAGGVMVVDSARRVTDRDGYDNQPSFTPDGTALLYTSIDVAGQADIRRYDLRTGATAPLTRTSPESEYSAAYSPDGRIAVIRVEADSTQRLWSLKPDGTDFRVVLENVRPAGYFAWLGTDRIALFVLGNPATLQLADVRTGAARTLAANIGRSLHRVPGRNAISFVHREDGAPGWITIWDAVSGDMTRLVQPFRENEYHAWSPTGTIVTARGSMLYALRPGTDSAWAEIGDLARFGIRGISRLAVSPDGSSIAVVAERDGSGV